MSAFYLLLGAAYAYDRATLGAEAGATKSEARAAGDRARATEARLERALMACEAMWLLLRDKLGVTDEELFDRIKEVDMTDGKLDGKVRRPPTPCPTCKRPMSGKFANCFYCGTAMQREPFA